ncbi:MAG: DUF3015 domain-containing protein [Candidatus Competibacteraceae bacterium]|nr:MAG: DUF3015 domain-containing protein [Candidatus Competibacteraceae bacterium]
MKLLLNAALIAALGLTAGACTIVTDPSSGSSAAGSSDQAGFLNRQQQIAEFAQANLDRLKTDMAAGQGEYLSSLATLMAIAPNDQPAFFAIVQQKFTVLFPNDRTTAPEMLTALNQQLRADPHFGQQLALN